MKRFWRNIRAAVELMKDSDFRKNYEVSPKEWTATHDGHEILVRNSWNRGIKLYIDGDCRVEMSEKIALSRTKPVLSYPMVSGDTSFLVEVFCFALFTVKAKIVVDGQQIGGDEF
jgi:hypothetical protein